MTKSDSQPQLVLCGFVFQTSFVVLSPCNLRKTCERATSLILIAGDQSVGCCWQDFCLNYSGSFVSNS